MKDVIDQEIVWLLQEKYKGQMIAEAVRDVERLRTGEHVDYVIGRVKFLGCEIDLSRKPFIPRPETEYWVAQAIQEIRRRKKEHVRVLDLFSGSGCIGLAVLKHVPQARVTFAEKEEKFCTQIEINAKLNKISPSRYHIVQSDIFENIAEKYDYILANPPYVPERNRTRVQQSVLDNDPCDAVFGGADGLLYIKEFLGDAKEYLKKGGSIFMEFDPPQKEDIERFVHLDFSSRCHFFQQDQLGTLRYVIIQRKEGQPAGKPSFGSSGI